MDLVLDGAELSIHDLESVARDNRNVSISDDAWNRIKACREMIQQKIDAHEVMYGVTTGIGAVINTAKMEEGSNVDIRI